MTPLPYQLEASSNPDGSYSGRLSYNGTEIGSFEGLREKDVEKWARTTAADHKARISPAEYRQVLITQSIVL